MICPKCKHERTSKDDPLIPDYQCPRCGVIYAKFKTDADKVIEVQNKRHKKVVRVSLISKAVDFFKKATNNLTLKSLPDRVKKRDWNEITIIYFNQAMAEVKKGNNPYDLLYESQKASLNHFKEMGVNRVTISASGVGNSCDSCQSLDGKEMSITTALKSMPLPHKNCTNDVFESGVPWCRCMWLGRIQ